MQAPIHATIKGFTLGAGLDPGWTQATSHAALVIDSASWKQQAEEHSSPQH